MSKSKDMVASDAIKQIKELSTVKDLRSFSKGDSRKTVNDAIESRIDSLKSKKITKTEKEVKKTTSPSR